MHKISKKRPSITTDAAVVRNNKEILLITRKN